MFGYLVRRLTGTLPVLLAVSVFVFAFVHLLPGDPARMVAGPEASLEQVEGVRVALWLDRPIWEQYFRYLDQMAHLEFGRSIKTHEPVAFLIGQRFMPTLWLTVASMAWALAGGVALGVLSGVRRGGWEDRAAMIFAVSGISFPGFWLGLMLIDLFSVRLGWLPTGGYGGWPYASPHFRLNLSRNKRIRMGVVSFRKESGRGGLDS